MNYLLSFGSDAKLQVTLKQLMLKTPCAREEQKQLTRIFDTWAIPCLSSQLNLKVCGCSFGQNILARPAGLETVVTSRVRWSQLPPAWRADAAGWRRPRRIPAVTRNTGLTDQVSPLSMYSRPEASCHAPADWLTGLPVAVMSTGKPAQAERGLGQGAPDEIRRWRPAGSDGRILIVATRILADEGNASRLACVFQYFRGSPGVSYATARHQ